MELMLLTVAFIGIVIVLLTKYVWQGSVLTVASFLIYFFIEASGSWEYFLVLLVGLMLLILELFLPSFGAVGIIGIAMTLLGINMTSDNPTLTLLNASYALCIALGVAVFLWKMGCRFQLGRGLVLNQSLTSDKGFQSFQQDYAQYLNTVGVTVTSLRPVGRARFGDEELEVLSSGKMIESHKDVVVYKVEGSKLFVREIQK
ncbi:hypothetical protein KG090_05150 [Carnobacteriaceae bacterium zg-ZUI240]|nr:hypothetical protein [Carnobacteriaceae bacterium zg-ZUI240]